MFKDFIKSVHGYVLPYILLITILVVSLLLSLISIVFFNHLLEVKKIIKKKLDLACYSAVQKHISEIESIKEGSGIARIDSINVLLKYRYNGFFYEVTAQAKNNRDSSKVQYLFANKLSDQFNNAIIISRPNLRATVTGNTKITGDIFCTTDKITRGNIFGINSSSNNYLEGKITIKDNIKIKLYIDSLYKVIKSNSNTGQTQENQVIGSANISPFQNRIRNLENLTLSENNVSILDSADNFQISGDLIIKGRLEIPDRQVSNKKFVVNGKTIFEKGTAWDIESEIISDSSVVFEGESKIENLTILASKEIEIKSKTKFTTTQLISQKKIEIINSQFNYPSIIGLYVDTGKLQNLQDEININSSTINGTVFLTSSTAGLGNNKSKITIDNSSKVNGLIYSDNNVDVEGQVTGIIYTYNFWYYKEPTEYINWLVNLNVDRTKLSNWFLLPLGFSKDINLEVLKEKWIY